ncbi:hypothetical protein [Streptomyces sedi]|uniref:Uncharacterized protein n=1 Tax=Streptomyces sedi TaxID=555059 RepID=A0A5C4UMI2_9ACTN|nr:hypothetical protein [Streptomyces sedi]TNM24585.1 hypothetical protein FH715_27290 [Streptomyces sedi]
MPNTDSSPGGDKPDRLVALAHDLHLDPSDLAGPLHHLAYQQALTDTDSTPTRRAPSATDVPEEVAFRAARAINDAGMTHQVTYLRSRVGATATERLLRTTATPRTLDDLGLLDDLGPAGALTTASHLDTRAPELTVLAHHRSLDHREDYLLLHDTAAIWSPLPGAREYLGLHLTRDASTFHLDHQRMPLLPLTQAWLRARGCPPLLHPAGGPAPADAATVRIEHTLANSPDRYELIEDYTHNPGTGDTRTCAILRDHHPDAASPHRLLVEDVTLPQAFTYRIAEYGHATAREASEAFEAHLARPPAPPLGRLPPPPTSPSSPDRRRSLG